MNYFAKILTVSGLMLASPFSTVHADELFTDDVIVFDNLLCVGFNCLLGETEIPGRSGLKLNDQNMAILFEDNSTVGPSNDWQIRINGTTGNGNFFAIDDVTNGKSPFYIVANAPDNALYVASDGKLGLGTEVPIRDIHITNPSNAGLRLERTTGGGLVHTTWDIEAGSQGLTVHDPLSGRTPLTIRPATPDHALVLDISGRVGVGTQFPDGKLHTKGDGVQLAYFESGNGDAVQVRFRTDSENRRFLAVNNADQVQTQMQFRDDAILFLGQTVAQEWLRVDANGITTAGPTCSSPCDLTFDPEVFTVPPIAERAAYMWQNRHLPAIGPTSPAQPMNLTEKMGGVVHELEVAHIYIEQLHDEIARLKAEKSQSDAAQEARFMHLHARLEALEAKSRF